MSIANLFSDDGNVIPMETQTWNALALSEGFQPNTVVLSNETGYLGSINSKSTTLNAPEVLFNSNSVKIVPDDYNVNAFQVVDQNGSNLFNVNNSTPDTLNNPSVKIGNASIVITGYEGSITDYELLTGSGGGGNGNVVASDPMTAGSLTIATGTAAITSTDQYSGIINSTGRFWFNDFNGNLILGINALKDYPDQSNILITTPLGVNGTLTLNSLSITSDNTNGTITNTELSYLAGCTSNIQQQINSMASRPPYIPMNNPQSGTDYTVLPSDHGKLICLSYGIYQSTHTNINFDGNYTYPLGFYCDMFVWALAGTYPPSAGVGFKINGINNINIISMYTNPMTGINPQGLVGVGAWVRCVNYSPPSVDRRIFIWGNQGYVKLSSSLDVLENEESTDTKHQEKTKLNYDKK